jgi:CubicO group peptidase (beta-lactamase class C family)
MKCSNIVILTVLLLFCTGNAMVMDSYVNSGMSRRNQNTADLALAMPDIEFYDSPLPYDSASLDSFIDTMMALVHYAGLQTIAIKDGQIIWQRAYGHADLSDSTLVTNSTLFYMASVSKPITATALMQLWEFGAFELDYDINDYLDFPVNNPNHPDSAITFRHLLTHTSSISDNHSVLDSLTVSGEDCQIPLGEFLENYLQPGGLYYSQSHYSDSIPGTDYRYSNVGMSLAGYLVEAIADSFPTWCQDSLFGRLDMDETSWFLSCLDTNNIAKPYMWTGTSYIRVPFVGKPHYPAVQLRTSATQLSRFLQAFMQHGIMDTVRILDSLTVALMTTEHVNIGGMWMGFSWFHLDYYGRWIWAHDGQLNPGGRTLMAFCPDENSAAIALANGDAVGGVDMIIDALFDYAEQYTNVEEYITTAPRMVTLQVTPNPFTQMTDIRYQITDNGTIHSDESANLKIYDVSGRLVKDFGQLSVADQKSSVQWSGDDKAGRNLPCGVYFVTMHAGEYSETKKVMLVK